MKQTIVIGGGIIGISCALKLQASGNQVSVLDPGLVGDGASKASCGYIATSDVVPLSRPNTLLKVPGWLINPLAPLSIRPSSLPFILPWLLKFTANATKTKVKQISQDIAALNRNALTDTQEFLKDYNLSHLLTNYPVIQVYDTHKEAAEEEEFHKLRSDLGFKLEHISGAVAKELEPALASDFACATLYQDWRCIIDPQIYVKGLYDAFLAKGGKFIGTKIIDAEVDNGIIRKITTAAGEEFSADEFVLAAGTDSKQIAAKFGVKITLEGVIGYSTYFANHSTNNAIKLVNGVIYAKGGFGITPYSNLEGSGIAVAGTIEFARSNAQPNWKRADILVKQACRVLPQLATIINSKNNENSVGERSKGGIKTGGIKTGGINTGERKMGRRPFTPDTKPLIGRPNKLKNLIIATGHGQLGIAMAATTAGLVTDLVANRKPNIDLSAYAPER